MNGHVPFREKLTVLPAINEDAITGLGIIVLLTIIFVIGIHITFNVLDCPVPPPRHVGLLPAAMQGTADQLNVYGSIAGFSAINGPVGSVNVWWNNASADRLGGAGLTLSIFTGGEGGIDMAKTAVLWTDRTGTETIPPTRQATVICPNWTIVYRHAIDPAKPANDDDILEPGELFDIFACPVKTYAPYEEFTIEFDPPGSGPHFPVECSVPSPVSRTMEL